MSLSGIQVFPENEKSHVGWVKWNGTHQHNKYLVPYYGLQIDFDYFPLSGWVALRSTHPTGTAGDCGIMSLDLKFSLNADNLKPGHKIQMKRYIQRNVCKKEETGKVEISVCLATHNGEKYIAEQLESILRQLGKRDEVIVSDDSSTDKTLAIIENFHDSRIKIFPGNAFYNPIFNFENALKQAAGEVIVLSDQDDIWLDHKLDVIRQRFQNRPAEIYTIVLDGQMIDETNAVIGESIFETLSSGKGLLKNLKKNTYMGCCMAFSRELLEILLPFPKKIPMHDSWIGFLSELFGVVEFVPEKTIKYRKHRVNRSLQTFKLSRKISWRYFLILNLIRRWISHVGLVQKNKYF